MKRLAVSCITLMLCVGVEFATPGRVAAAPPPPCPIGSTFIWCDTQCPFDLNAYCLVRAYHPANCRVVDSYCVYTPCMDLEQSGDTQVFCTYDAG